MGSGTAAPGLFGQGQMSRLADLQATARATDERADWLRLWQAIAGTRLVVPVADPSADRIQPLVVSIEGTPAVQAYEDMDTFAIALSEPGACAEVSGADLAQMLAGSDHALAITLPETEEPLFLSLDVLDWIARTYRAAVDRTQAEGVRMSAPDLPAPEVIELLGQTISALGDDCPEAWLVAMTHDGRAPEPVLVLGLSDRVAEIEAEIAETVTRAIQPGLATPIAVACAARGSRLMHRARECGIGIG